MRTSRLLLLATAVMVLSTLSQGCARKQEAGGFGDAAAQVYVPPGSYDEFYAFMSGGFSGQVAVYGLPSGRLFSVIPVFSQDPEKGYGYSEETKPLLMTSYGFQPWDDAHHPQLSVTNGVADGRWLFINDNNTPRIARIDLTTFRNRRDDRDSQLRRKPRLALRDPEHGVRGGSTRFSVPIPQRDVPIDSYKENFKGTHHPSSRSTPRPGG